MKCHKCQRGLMYDIRTKKARCYVCGIEVTLDDREWKEFDVTPEVVQITADDMVVAMLMEVLGSTQKELARKMNITAQFLSDVLKGRRAVTDVIAKYYGFRRACFFVPDTPYREDKTK